MKKYNGSHHETGAEVRNRIHGGETFLTKSTLDASIINKLKNKEIENYKQIYKLLC